MLLDARHLSKIKHQQIRLASGFSIWQFRKTEFFLHIDLIILFICNFLKVCKCLRFYRLGQFV